MLDLSKEPRPVDVLWLVGCYPSYYPRNQVVARALARILTELGVTWGVLGTKEKAVGECDRMFGEEGLFETLVEENRKLFDQQNSSKIVVLDPHAYRALQHFYPRFGVTTRCSTTPCSWPSVSDSCGADGQAGRGDGHVSRQLLPGPACGCYDPPRPLCN